MNDNSNDDLNMMAKYFVHSSQNQNQSQNQNDNTDLSNLINKETMNNQNMNLNMNNSTNTNMNSQMNSSFESTMTNQMNLNNEIMNDLIGVDYQDKKLIKLIRSFKKNNII